MSVEQQPKASRLKEREWEVLLRDNPTTQVEWKL